MGREMEGKERGGTWKQDKEESDEKQIGWRDV